MIRLPKEINNIKALVIEDFSTGKVSVEYDKRKFETILNKSTYWEITKIYELTNDNRDYLINEILNNGKINEENKIDVSINGEDIIRNILPIITDIPFDKNIIEDMEELKELLKNPTEVFKVVVGVVSDLLSNTLNDFIRNVNKIDELPKETQEILKQSIEKDDLQKQVNDEKKLKNNIKELESIVGQ